MPWNKRLPKISSLNPYRFRMLPLLKETLLARAKANNRSLNAEITARLEKSLADEDQTTQTPVRHHANDQHRADPVRAVDAGVNA